MHSSCFRLDDNRKPVVWRDSPSGISTIPIPSLMAKSFFAEPVYPGLVLAVMWLLGAGELIRWSEMEALREIFQRRFSAV